jgi:hypothetical protein
MAGLFAIPPHTDKPLSDGAELLKEIDVSVCVSSSSLNEKIENKPIPKA